MNIEDSNQSTNVVVGVIRDLTKTVEDTKDRLEQYEVASSKDRADFKQSIEANIDAIKQANAQSIVQLRKDFNRALQPIMLETLDSRKGREDLLKSLNDDYATRTQRQIQVDRQFTIIIVVLVAVVVVVVVTLVFVLIAWGRK